MEQIRADRVASGEPEEGAMTSDRDVRRWLKEFKKHG
jgi:hypothetical protein